MKRFRWKTRALPALTAVVLCAVTLVILYRFHTHPQAIAVGSWGLSFQNEGQAPVGNASADQLRQYDAAFVGDGDQPVIYLTFDAGYENGCTEPILDALKKHQAPAVFFVVGSYVEQNPDLIRRMVTEGHTVGNHTFHHCDMSKITNRDTFAKELRDVAEAYESIVGQPMMPYYRPPQGIYSEENLRLAQELGYKTVFWSLAYVDWKQDAQPTAQQAYDKLLPRIHNGAIVLLHSTSQTNAAILDDLLTKWEAMGYRFGDISEVFAS